MSNSDLNKMVSAALEKDAIAFKNAFDSLAMDKISTAIDNRTQQISKDIVKNVEIETEK